MENETIIFDEHQLKKNFNENIPYNSSLKAKARELRKAGVLSEVLFWQRVHKRKFYSLEPV